MWQGIVVKLCWHGERNIDGDINARVEGWETVKTVGSPGGIAAFRIEIVETDTHPGAGVHAVHAWSQGLSERVFSVGCRPQRDPRVVHGSGGELAAMKPTSHLSMSGRADLVDEAALFDALKTWRIKGAALDVW